MLSSFLSAVLAVFIAYCVRWRLEMFRTFRKRNIPGPPPRFLWGNLWEIYRHGHLVMQRKWHEQYGPVVGYFYGLMPVVLVADAELLRRMLFKDFHKFADRSDLINGSFTGGFDHSLIVLRGQRWKTVRATLTPSFTSKKLKEITPAMSACVDSFMENVDKDFTSATECDLYEAFQALTLDTICRVGMGVDYEVQKDFRNSKVLRRARSVLAFDYGIFFLFFVSFPSLLLLFGKFMMRLNFTLNNRWEDPIEALKKDTREVVKLRRSDPEKMRRSDLLQLMMDAQASAAAGDNMASLIAGDVAESIEAEKNATPGNPETPDARRHPSNRPKGLTDSEVLDNAFLLLLAGYETTSSSLAFLSKMLLRFPEVQERLRAELFEATDGGTVFDFERLQKCQYTEAVLQETLRMYTPIYLFTARVAAEDVKYGKMTIPKGITVFVSANEVHYNEDVFRYPYEFRPERFLPENKTPAMTAAFLPFGAGPRNCIGMRFAQMEIKVTLAKLLTKYRISSGDEPQHNPLIRTMVNPILQQISDPLKCKLELL